MNRRTDERTPSAPMTQQDRVAQARAQRLLQIGAMDAEIRRVEARLVASAEPHAMARNPRAGATVAVDQLGRLGRRAADSVEKVEARELACGVRRQCDRRSDFRELRRLLVEIRREAARTQRVGQHEPADAGADDRDRRCFHARGCTMRRARMARIVPWLC
jgi:hypothetical protein